MEFLAVLFCTEFATIIEVYQKTNCQGYNYECYLNINVIVIIMPFLEKFNNINSQ